MPFEIIAFRGRTVNYDGTLSGDSSVLDPSDNLRFKIGRCSGQPVLDLIDGQQTPAGSYISILDPGTQAGSGSGSGSGSGLIAATYTIHLAPGDTAEWMMGCYDVELLHVTAQDGGPGIGTHVIEIGVLHVLDTLSGNIGQ